MAMPESRGSHMALSESRGGSQHMGSQSSQFSNFHHNSVSGVQGTTLLSPMNSNGSMMTNNLSGTNLSSVSGAGLSNNLGGVSGSGLSSLGGVSGSGLSSLSGSMASNGMHHSAAGASFQSFTAQTQLPLGPMNHSVGGGMGMYQPQMMQDVPPNSMLHLMSNLEGQSAAHFY
jgi:hypothetical protein